MGSDVHHSCICTRPDEENVLWCLWHQFYVLPSYEFCYDFHISCFYNSDHQVFMPTSTKFFITTVRLGHTFAPTILRAWLIDGQHHPLCPVGNLREYVRDTYPTAPPHLFVWTETLSPLQCLHIYSLLWGFFKDEDNGSAHKGHDVSALSASLDFLCHYSIE